MTEQPDWTRAYLLQGRDSEGKPITILLEADGRMLALLTGIYAGEYHPLAVDENGRLEAFVLDSENQWGDILKIGNAELASRLGSPVVHDWRGQAVHFNTFSQGTAGLALSTVGTNPYIRMNPVFWHQGGYSLALYGGTAATGFAFAQGGVGPSPTTRPGFAISFTLSAKVGKLGISISHGKTNIGKAGEARLNYTNSTVQVRNGSTATWESIGAFDPTFSSNVFYNLKLVIDTESNTYDHVLYNDVEYDGAGKPIIDPAILSAPTLAYAFWTNTETGYQGIAYVDSYILTVNEP